MAEFSVHRTGDEYVIDADSAALAGLFNAVLNDHLLRPPIDPAESQRLALTAASLRAIRPLLPQGPRFSNWDEYFAAHDVPGVAFVSASSRVVIGVDADLARGLTDALELVVRQGDYDDLQTLAGLHYAQFRDMYMTISGSIGRRKHAREVAFGHD